MATEACKKVIKSMMAVLEKMKSFRDNALVKDAYTNLAGKMAGMQHTMAGLDNIHVTEMMPDGSTASCEAVQWPTQQPH